MFRLLLSTLAAAAIAAPVLAVPHAHAHHGHVASRALPNTWYHDDGHFASALFARDADDAVASGTTVGSPEWVAAYPTAKPDPLKMPKSWWNALAAATAANKIPNIPPSTMVPNVGPRYPPGIDALSKDVCNAAWKCRRPDDVWDAPDGVFALNFDDGPLPESEPLYEFLQQQQQHATHFMIGLNIIRNQNGFMRAFKDLQDDIAVHTWSHPYMTTLTNEEIVAELGYSLQIISDMSGGRIARYWRPPTGDTDNRVRAIALEIFGLETIIWNQDTEDWSITTGGTTQEIVEASLEKWITGPKTPGLIILEHELSNQSVSAFINKFPLVKQNGWNPMPVTRMRDGMAPYKNAADNTAAVTSIPFLANGYDTAADVSITYSPSSSSSSSSSASSSSVASASSAKSSNVALPASQTLSRLSSAEPSQTGQAGQAQDNGVPDLLPSTLATLFAGLLALALST